MKKFALILIPMIISGVLFAQSNVTTEITDSNSQIHIEEQKLDKNVDITNIKTMNDVKIEEKKRLLIKSYNANQKRLQRKKEELNKLLEK